MKNLTEKEIQEKEERLAALKEFNSKLPPLVFAKKETQEVLDWEKLVKEGKARRTLSGFRLIK